MKPEQAFVVSADGTLATSGQARKEGFYLSSTQQFSDFQLDLEFQFQDREVHGNPFVSVGLSLPTRMVAIGPKNTVWYRGQTCSQSCWSLDIPSAEFKAQLLVGQKRDSAKPMRVFPIRNLENQK